MAYVGTYRALLAGGVARPALVLDFIGLNVLDRRITFSRGSNATLTDSTGKITYAPANLLVRSEEFDNASWTKNNVTITADATTSPNGSLTAEKFVASATSGYHLVSASVTTTAATYTYSAYFKAAEYSKAMLSNGTNGTWAAAFDLSAGTTVGTFGPAVLSSAIANAGNGWYRCSVTFTATAAAISHSAGGYPSSGATLGGYGAQYTGDGTSGVYIWGAQLEPVTYQTTPSTYQATTSSAYYGPRFDYDPVTLAAKGLLIEEQRTNLLTYSEQFNNAAWPKQTATITANAAVAPDGTTTADKIIPNNGSNGYVYRNTGVSSGSVAFSIFVKAAEWGFVRVTFGGSFSPTGNTYIRLSDGAVTSGSGFTAQSFGNGWFRITGSSTYSSATDNTIYVIPTNSGTSGTTGDGTSGIFIWGAQLEAGAFATSYIPTVASTVTRSADVATMSGANFSAWYNQAQGSFVVSARDPGSGTRTIVAADDNSANNAIRLYSSALDPKFIVVTGGATQADIDAGSITANTSFKLGGAYAVNNFAASVAGGAAATDTSGTLPTVDRLRIGTDQAGNYLNGAVASIAYYNTRLPNATLQSLTS